MYGWIEAAKLLIEAGANINALNTFGRSALHFSVEFKHEKLLEYLLTRDDLFINVADTEG
jgi:ankyrin repeat protein